jgi:phosphotriesterase-related protein
VVDWTPIGLGRDLDGLVHVAGATGLHVVAATGLHRDAHYVTDDPLRAEAPERLADRFVEELEGRCGIIKAGASYHHLTPFEEKAFEAAAAAHVRTGAPVCVHTQHGTMGLALVERLQALGVPPSSVVLAHVDRNPDAGEHAETASTGATLQLDGPGRAKYWPDSTILRLIDDLASAGHAERLLLGGDTGRRGMLRAYGGGPGLDYVFARFKPRLERELGEGLARAIFVDNPARAFAWEPRA